MENNISASVVNTYKQYIFGKVAVIISKDTLYIECDQTKDDITYESSMLFDISKEKAILKKLSLEIHDYRLSNDILFRMESNIDIYIHDTLMTILDVVLTKGLKPEGIVYSKYK